MIWIVLASIALYISIYIWPSRLASYPIEFFEIAAFTALAGLFSYLGIPGSLIIMLCCAASIFGYRYLRKNFK